LGVALVYLSFDIDVRPVRRLALAALLLIVVVAIVRLIFQSLLRCSLTVTDCRAVLPIDLWVMWRIDLFARSR
jgi:hypothetical protein